LNNLYTVILDFRGGTYIAQVSRSSPTKAVIDWSNEISKDEAQTWKLDVRQLQRLLQEDELVALDGLANAWCTTARIGRHLALINVIQTVPASGD
jgi:hypothetical protein